MVDLETARKLCLSFAETNEHDHFDKPAYRVKKKIFVTLHLDQKRAVLKFSPDEQEQLCDRYAPAVFPVNGAWGKFGWTYVDLDKISESVFKEALAVAWRNVAPKSLQKIV